MQLPEAQLIRSIDCFNDAVMFIDVSHPKWKVMHLNSAAQTRLKLHGVAWSTEEGANSLLWDLFQVSYQPWGGLDSPLWAVYGFAYPSPVPPHFNNCPPTYARFRPFEGFKLTSERGTSLIAFLFLEY